MLFVLISYLIFLLIKPFISVLLGSVILSYAFYPLYKQIESRIKRPIISAAITTTVVFFIILVPLLFVLNIITVESISTYQIIKNYDFSKLTLFLDERFSQYIGEIVNKVLLFFVQATSKLVLSIPHIALNFFILFFFIFYFLKDNKSIANHLGNYFPFRNKELFISRFDQLTKALIYGTLLIAVIQGILGGIAFLIFDVPSPILWGFAIAIASLIPFAGTALVWIPAAVSKLIQGDLVSGMGLLLFGVLIVSSADNILRPYLVSSRAKVHPAIVLLGVLGGLKLFGFIGIIIGPLFLALAIEFIKFKDTGSD